MDVGMGREGVQAEATQRQGFVVEGYMVHVMNGRKLNLAATQSPGAEGHMHAGLQRTSGIRGFSAALCERFGGKR